MQLRDQTLLPLLTMSLIVSAILGLVLRILPFVDVPLSYDYLRHAHSHWGFLGWAFASLALLIPSAFGIDRLQRTWYRVMWIATQVVAFVAVVILALTGYSTAAVVALATHGVLSGLMLASIIVTLPNAMSSRFIQFACAAAIASTLGPLLSSVLPSFLPVAATFSTADGARVYMSMQIEGFFMAGVFGLIVRMIERDSGHASPWLMIPALLCLIGAMIPTSDIIAASLRAASIVAIVLVVIRNMPRLLHVLSGTSTMVIFVVIGAMILRSMAALVLAALALLWHDVYFFTLNILLLHVMFLGILTPVIFISLRVWFSMRLSRITWIVYTIGVTGTLVTLLTQSIGLALPYTSEALLAFAGVIVLAAVMIVPASVRRLVTSDEFHFVRR